MKSREVYSELGRRERQLMEIVYRRGPSTATEIRDELPDPPSYSAVRGMLRLLEDKGYLRHEQDGPRYIYIATASRNNVSKSAVRDLVRTFFDDSASAAVAAMIGQYEGHLSDADLDRLEQLIERARTADRKNTKGGRS